MVLLEAAELGEAVKNACQSLLVVKTLSIFVWACKSKFQTFLYPQGNTVPAVLKFHGVITTFEMIMADCPELKKLHWRCVVIDEAHRLKNRNCKLLEGLKLMNLVSLICVMIIIVSDSSN